MPDGSLSIIDYKTGGSPSANQIKAGYAPQLSLEAVIATKGGFSTFPPKQVSELSYWELKGGEKPGDIKSFSLNAKGKANIDVMDLTQQSYDGLKKLVTTFDMQKTPYLSNPNPLEKGYGDYDHLARSKEWGDG
jgi:ATP-dependent helicase/nuclease subunit B